MADRFNLFTENGAVLNCPEEAFFQKLENIKAFVFDWDGVFNDGRKNENMVSYYSETDSMGLNLLRFGYWLKYGTIPFTAVITGLQNSAALQLAKREHFHAIYTGIKHKKEALKKFADQHKLSLNQVAFTFDDVIDLSAAKEAGMRFFVKRKSNPGFNNFVMRNHLCEYMTACSGNENQVREVSEVILHSWNVLEDTFTERMNYSEKYQQYYRLRNQIETETPQISA